MNLKKLIEDSKEKELAILKKEISQLLSDKMYNDKIFTTFTFNGFYRARKHNEVNGNFKDGNFTEFINEKEFWNPPIEYAKMGRCNDEGESVFYCSTDFMTAILEVKPEVGDYITVSNFKNLYTDDIPRFKIRSIGNTYLSQIPALELLFQDYEMNSVQRDIEVFLDELFHQNVEEDEIYKYKLSTAITHIFLTDGINREGSRIETDGLLYPSIIRNKKSYCFVLKSYIAHFYFVINKIETIKILEKGEDFIKIKLCRKGFLTSKKIYPIDLFDIHWINSSKFKNLKY